MKAVLQAVFLAGLALFMTGCMQDPRVDALQARLDDQRQELAELREQLRILGAASQEQAAMRVIMEDMRRQLSALEVLRSPATQGNSVDVEVRTPRSMGIDINQGTETRAQVIEIPQ